MKFVSIEYGNSPYQKIYSIKKEITKVDELYGVSNYNDDYRTWCISKEYTCLRMCYYERNDITGEMILIDKYEWNCLKPAPRVLNNPGKQFV